MCSNIVIKPFIRLAPVLYTIWDFLFRLYTVYLVRRYNINFSTPSLKLWDDFHSSMKRSTIHFFCFLNEILYMQQRKIPQTMCTALFRNVKVLNSNTVSRFGPNVTISLSFSRQKLRNCLIFILEKTSMIFA